MGTSERKVGLSALLLSLLVSVQSCSSSQAPAPPATVHDTKAATVLDGASLVLDVRTPEEYAQGHLDDALLIPVAELEARLAEVDSALAGEKNKKIVTYCKAGRRAGQAKLLLEQHGYTNVVNGGGYDDLK